MGVDCIYPGQGKGKWWAFVKTVVNLFSLTCREFLDLVRKFSFSRRTVPWNLFSFVSQSVSHVVTQSIHSFIYSFIHSFTRSVIQPLLVSHCPLFIRLFIYLFNQSVNLSVTQPVRSFVPSFTQSVIQSHSVSLQLVSHCHSLIQLVSRSLIHSSIHSVIVNHSVIRCHCQSVGQFPQTAANHFPSLLCCTTQHCSSQSG